MLSKLAFSQTFEHPQEGERYGFKMVQTKLLKKIWWWSQTCLRRRHEQQARAPHNTQGRRAHFILFSEIMVRREYKAFSGKGPAWASHHGDQMETAPGRKRYFDSQFLWFQSTVLSLTVLMLLGQWWHRTPHRQVVQETSDVTMGRKQRERERGGLPIQYNLQKHLFSDLLALASSHF